MSATSRLINYYLDGPCGDCPKSLNPRFKDCMDFCISLIAWDESKNTVRTLEEKVAE